MLEVHLMVPALLQDEPLSEGDWREVLCNDLLSPTYKMSRWEAIGRRLSRTYIWLFLIVLGSWLLLAWVRAPKDGELLHRLQQAFTYESIPPEYVVLGMAVFYAYLLILLIGTSGKRQVNTEIRRKEPSRQHWPI